MAKKPLGTSAASPASTDVVPSGRPAPPVAAVLALLENLVDGTMYAPPKAKCLPAGSRDMPAGFHQTVLASSATAAAPAYAFPRPLRPCSCSAKPAECTLDVAKAASADATAQATMFRFMALLPERAKTLACFARLSQRPDAFQTIRR